MKIAILFAEITEEAGKDEQDVLVQVEAVRASMLALGHETSLLPITLDLQKAATELDRMRPDLVFNLVESLAGAGRFLHFAPALLEHMRIPFTGSGSESLYITTGKILSKERLRYAGIATPNWMPGNALNDSDLNFDPPYIIKPAWEDASIGLDDASIVHTRENLTRVFREKAERFGGCFVESFIDGREFNVSMLAEGKHGAQVLPAAEITFKDFPTGKPRIVGYDAKWETGSFEYLNTPRTFDFSETDGSLLKRLENISRRCWDIFDLRGYARVDFRIDRDSKPWVIEINANPCISPDAGFTAAANRAGLSYDRMIERILENSCSPY
jgi:D-alanine-D-alanine ligase